MTNLRKRKNWFLRFIWRLQFEKVTVTNICEFMNAGRCTFCDAGKGSVECTVFKCPCKFDQYLKRKRTFNWLYKTKLHENR